MVNTVRHEDAAASPPPVICPVPLGIRRTCPKTGMGTHGLYLTQTTTINQMLDGHGSAGEAQILGNHQRNLGRISRVNHRLAT